MNQPALAMKRSAPESNSAGSLNQEDTQKRSVEEISSTVQYKHLKNCLSNAQNQVNNLEKDQKNEFVVELEARFGTITKKGPQGTSFAPALQLADFNRLKQHLDGAGMDIYDEEKIDYSYVAGADKTSQIRITTEDDSNLDGEVAILRKMKVDHVDLAFPSLTHDVRVAVALEIELTEEDLPQNFNKMNYRGFRKKKRTVYQKEGEPWKYELTIVESVQSSDMMASGKAKNNQGDITYEAEIELDSSVSEWFREKKNLSSTEKFQDLVTNFYKSIRNVLDILGGQQNVGGEVQNTCVAPFPEVKEILVSTDTIVSKLKERVGRCFGEDSIHNFPGSMPVTFGRRHISTVMSNDYMISEKTDGVRYMFLICPEGSFIINRSYNFYKVSFDLKELFSKDNTSTLLDGELVRHHDGRVIFLVFDVVSINGAPFYQEGFKNRYQAIGQLAIGPYRVWKQQSGNSSGLPFDIMQKIFHPKENVESFFKGILKEGNHKYYRDEKRYHKTDGLIITPTTPYALRKAVTLFKWKYAELQSIDFVATLGEDVDHFHLFIGVDGNLEQECYYTTFPPEDLHRLKADWRKHHGNATRAIIECLYDTRMGMWRYYAMRPDKNVANFITTMCDTWLGIAENVTEAELIRAFARKPQQNQQQHQQHHHQQHHHQQHHHQQHHHQQQQQQYQKQSQQPQQQQPYKQQPLALPSSTSTSSVNQFSEPVHSTNGPTNSNDLNAS